MKIYFKVYYNTLDHSRRLQSEYNCGSTFKFNRLWVRCVESTHDTVGAYDLLVSEVSLYRWIKYKLFKC